MKRPSFTNGAALVSASVTQASNVHCTASLQQFGHGFLSLANAAHFVRRVRSLPTYLMVLFLLFIIFAILSQIYGLTDIKFYVVAAAFAALLLVGVVLAVVKPDSLLLWESGWLQHQAMIMGTEHQQMAAETALSLPSILAPEPPEGQETRALPPSGG